MEANSGGYIYWAMQRKGKYLPLFTDTEVNYCFSIYQTNEIASLKIIIYSFILRKLRFSQKHAQEVTSDHNIWQSPKSVWLVCWMDFSRVWRYVFGILLLFLTYKTVESFIFVILYMLYHSTSAWETTHFEVEIAVENVKL